MVNDSDTLEYANRRVVAALQVNPRAGVGEIARILGEHERTVARRVQRLADSRAIRPTATYDVMRCGLGNSVGLRLQAAPGALEKTAQALAEHPELRTVLALCGRSSTLWCETLLPYGSRLHTLMAEGVPGLPGLPDITLVEAHFTLKTFTTEASWHVPLLAPDERRQLLASMVQPLADLADHYELTPTDRRVADALAEDARISLTDLSRRFGFSVATAGRRVSSLLERRMIQLRTEIEPALLGHPFEAQLHLKVGPAGLDHVGAELAGCPEVRYCAAVTGTSNLLVQVCVESEAHLYRFLGERLGALPQITEVATELVVHAFKRGSVLKDGVLAAHPNQP
ncbi:Lrp/AsnC ligand binding domain-containing protein [Streptomyces sp. NPDC006649]|uniref:Lrp/AsnC family transcriptional regulator n=1 Tax=Streptomyces sp. NPDC006649 TaxID=3156896 RepID=UPI0033A33389